MSKEILIALSIGLLMVSAFSIKRIFIQKNSLADRIVALEVKVAYLEEKLQ